MPPTFAAAPQCATCSRAVYFAEQQVGPGGKVYHKGCLRCQSCSKTLDALGLLDHDGEPYCKPCHGKSFGAKGYGVGTALVGEYTDRIASPLATSPFRPRASPFATPTKVDAPETAKFSVSSAHSLTGSPAGSPRWATSAGTPTYGKVPGSAGSLMRDGERTAPSPKYGSGGDLCRRCQTVVYFAESVSASRLSYLAAR